MFVTYFGYETKILQTAFWRPDFFIWRLKKNFQSPLGACIKKLISDPVSASNIPQITSRQSNILYFFQFKYPKCFSTLFTCGCKDPTSPSLRKLRNLCSFFSFYLLQQADSIVIVGIADGSPAVGQVDLTYSFIFLDTCTLMIL